MSDNSKSVHVSIAFKNTEATDPLKKYAEDKFTHSLGKFVREPTEAHVVLKVEKNRHLAEITVHAAGADFHVKEESASLYTSIDAASESLSNQLRKHKEKITSHH